MPGAHYILVGGGLQNALVASALCAKQPRARVTLIERASSFGGNHTWCFHAADVPDAARSFVEPFIARRWLRQEVHFPARNRVLEERYYAVTSESLRAGLDRLARTGNVVLSPNTTVTDVRWNRVELDSGGSVSGDVVVDARGPERSRRSNVLGFQKFLGQELRLRRGTAPPHPIIMDARVEQRDGLRFFYVLPLAEDRVLVEDTYLSDSAELDRERLRAEVAAYAGRAGYAVHEVVREETGVLPIPESATASAVRDGVLLGGYQGGWFHPTTGYSFPPAVRFALALADGEPSEASERVHRLERRELHQRRFAVLLNRMLFRAYAPPVRYRVLERFYGLPAPLIRRFYALALWPSDCARILGGWPPPGLSLTGLWTALRGRSLASSLGGYA